ncbi:MAG: ribonuclease III [Candidatus Komeilibacteria bacterium]
MKDLQLLESSLKLKFKNKEIIRSALTHRSYLNEHKNLGIDHNERLEFLGDAVLELVVTDYLFSNYPNPEGELTNWRSSLVNANTLADLAEEIEINDYLYLSRGEAKDSSSKARRIILANAYEALIGAIYLDQGYAKADKFIKERVLIKLEEILRKHLYIDPKSKLQEKSQELYGITPHYKVLGETGPDHHKKFVVGLYIDKEQIAQGEGYSKQEAQINAAAEGLKKKHW